MEFLGVYNVGFIDVERSELFLFIIISSVSEPVVLNYYGVLKLIGG